MQVILLRTTTVITAYLSSLPDVHASVVSPKLILVVLMLLPGAQVQSQPPIQGLVPYGDDD